MLRLKNSLLLVPLVVWASIPRQAELLAAILAAEDARRATPEGLAPVFDGLDSPDSLAQRIAVRALGRMERPSLVPRILPALAAGSPAVRMEAVNALGQAVLNGGGEQITDALIARLDTETDAGVRGVILHTLGRLPFTAGETITRVEDLLTNALASTGGTSVTAGAARGLEWLYRNHSGRHTPAARSTAVLYEAAGYGLPAAQRSGTPDGIATRRFAVAALLAARRTDADFLMQMLSDPDQEVRRLAALATRVQGDLAGRSGVIAVARLDGVAQVRYEALNAYGRHMQSDLGCEVVRSAILDPDTHVALLAIDLFGNGCAAGEPTDQILAGLALSPAEADSWHRAGHALVSLARVNPSMGASLLSAFVSHAVWQVQMYAARAATLLRDLPQLRALAAADHPNVREAAISGLGQLGIAGDDPVIVAALASPDYQLVRTAAAAMGGGADGPTVLPALRDALQRITAERRETSRDTRMAVLNAILQFDDDVPLDELTPYLRDFDVAIATRVAEALSLRTAQLLTVAPEPLPRSPLPSIDELRALGQTHVTLHMRGAGAIEIRLFPMEAPTNAARFARLAGEGYFDGLTFHRVAPNFVIQGGSPGANEFVGDGPYTRDEVTMRSHRRGTVGISTRGRDTGDAQIFVNLVDNVRLDHNYTIIGEVVRGMDVVDGVLEGATIQRATLDRQ
ncbi:MAG: peptidylprolyl isomerase [Gemmatimonadetes bacterium]|nr:peptidylprolyl isomerase [Gemmatimonadota bacterium]